MEATIGSVFLAAFITALVTGLGAVPFLFVRIISPWWLSIANGTAAGLMLGASHNLITEGTKLDPERMLLGILAGLIAIVAANSSGAGRSRLPNSTARAHVRRCSLS